MKRVFALLLLLALLAGCAAPSAKMPRDNTYHPETDFPYGMKQTVWSYDVVAEAEKGYYFYVPYMLFYMDRDGMEPAVLCSKPNCLHEKETELAKFRACQAYAFVYEAPRRAIAWYDGALYAIVEGEKDESGRRTKDLLRISADGSRRKTLYRFSPDDDIQEMIIHRGVVYLSMQSYMEDGRMHSGIWTVPLNGKGKPKCLIEYTVFQGTVLQNLTAYGQRLYFGRHISEEGDREFCIYDLDTQILTTIQKNEDGYTPWSATFSSGKMLLQYVADFRDENGLYPERVYRCDPDGSDPELVSEGMGCWTADAQYVYRVGMPANDGGADHWLHIYAPDFRELARFDLHTLEGGENLIFAEVYAAQGDQVLLITRERDWYARYYWFPRSEIETGSVTLRLFFECDEETYSEADKAYEDQR